MLRRTTLEIDEERLARARKVLGCRTKRETVEEALRRAVLAAEDQADELARRQTAFLERLAERVDLRVLDSDAMWR